MSAPMGGEPPPGWFDQLTAVKRDAEARKRNARAAFDMLTGPERVEVMRHFGQMPVQYVSVSCGCCDCCDCGQP